jgi:hypothetical protein
MVVTRRCVLLREVAQGGQVLLAAATASLVAGRLPDGAWIVDLGVHRLRDLSRPERVFEGVAPDPVAEPCSRGASMGCVSEQALLVVFVALTVGVW